MSVDCDDQKLLQEFKEWIRRDRKLPQSMGETKTSQFPWMKFRFFCSLSDDILLQRYLKVYDNGDLRKSQDLLKFNLGIRKTGPQIFKNRDILSDKTQVAAKTM